MRQLDACLKAMNHRQHNEIAMEASFHGIKIPTKEKAEEWSPEESKAAEQALLNAQRKMQAQMRPRRG